MDLIKLQEKDLSIVRQELQNFKEAYDILLVNFWFRQGMSLERINASIGPRLLSKQTDPKEFILGALKASYAFDVDHNSEDDHRLWASKIP